MYSQNEEEKFIIKHFKGVVGNFLDCGAYDGKTFSNTLKLAELGWGGVCFEPSPSVFPQLKKLHKNRKNIKCIQKGIGTESGMVKFFDSRGDAISSTSEKHKQKWEAGYKCNFDEIEVEMISIEDLFLDYGFQWDFVNIDVESTNMEIFNAFPWEMLERVKMLCIEHDSNISHIKSRMENIGFNECHRNGENIILVRD